MTYAIRYRIPIIVMAVAVIQLLILSMQGMGSFDFGALSIELGAAQLATALSITVPQAAGLLAGLTVALATGQVWVIVAVLGVSLGFAWALISTYVNHGFWSAAAM